MTFDPTGDQTRPAPSGVDAAEPSRGGDPAEIELVDLLCRMQLMAMRVGCRIVVVEPSAELRELIHLAGVDEVLLCPACEGPPLSPPVALPSPRQRGAGSEP